MWRSNVVSFVHWFLVTDTDRRWKENEIINLRRAHFQLCWHDARARTRVHQTCWSRLCQRHRNWIYKIQFVININIEIEFGHCIVVSLQTNYIRSISIFDHLWMRSRVFVQMRWTWILDIGGQMCVQKEKPSSLIPFFTLPNCFYIGQIILWLFFADALFILSIINCELKLTRAGGVRCWWCYVGACRTTITINADTFSLISIELKEKLWK